MARIYTRIPIEERFFKKVRKTDSCWLWTATKNNKGYGQMMIQKTPKHIVKLAHRISWEIAKGEIPDGLGVLHDCDTPLCVNPDHLFLGTQKQNIEDCISKGRNAAGERSGRAKLSAETVLQIRKEATGKRGDAAILAKKFGISREMAGNILARRNWKDI